MKAVADIGMSACALISPSWDVLAGGMDVTNVSTSSALVHESVMFIFPIWTVLDAIQDPGQGYALPTVRTCELMWCTGSRLRIFYKSS